MQKHYSNKITFLNKNGGLYRILPESKQQKIDGEFFLCIGLEIHAQIKTAKKLFSQALFNEDSQMNENVDFLDLGLPGTLPIPNKQAVLQALNTCLALNMHVNKTSIFDRKHYFYPDSPLGYQITQYFQPIGQKGFLECDFGTININRLHIESDAGKTINENGKIFVDLNRVGVGLMEIVTEPEFTNANEVISFLKELRSILLEVNSSDAEMNKGNFRVDVNISIYKENEPLGTRVEIKNLNSYQSIKKAIETEFELQKNTIKSGKQVVQCTKLFDVETNETKVIRSKEDFVDYGYFPDPDLLPIKITDEEYNDAVKNLPTLPSVYRKKFLSLNLTQEQVNIIMESKSRYWFFNALEKELPFEWFFYGIKIFCSDILGSIENFDEFLAKRKDFFEKFLNIIKFVQQNKLSKVNAKALFLEILTNESDLLEIINKKGYFNKIEINLDELILEVLNKNLQEVEKFKKGKTNILMFFVGQVMSLTKGQLSPDLVKEKVLEKLNSL